MLYNSKSWAHYDPVAFDLEEFIENFVKVMKIQ